MTKCQQLAKQKHEYPVYWQKLVEIVKYAISNPEKPQRILFPDRKEKY